MCCSWADMPCCLAYLVRSCSSMLLPAVLQAQQLPALQLGGQPLWPDMFFGLLNKFNPNNAAPSRPGNEAGVKPSMAQVNTTACQADRQ